MSGLVVVAKLPLPPPPRIGTWPWPARIGFARNERKILFFSWNGWNEIEVYITKLWLLRHNAAHRFVAVVHVLPSSSVVPPPWCDQLRIGSVCDHALHLLLLLWVPVPMLSLDPWSYAIVSPVSVIRNANRHCRAPVACAPSLIVLNCFPRRRSSVFALVSHHHPHYLRQRPIS